MQTLSSAIRDMHGIFICRRMDGNGRYTNLLAGTNDPEGDLSPVCDKNLGKHAGIVTRSTR